MALPHPDPHLPGLTGSAAGDVAALVASLGLAPHPEGGWFRRTWTSSSPAPHGAASPGGSSRAPSGPHPDDRAAASSILYLLAGEDRSAWHRLTDAEEVWVHQAGDPVLLRTSADGVTERTVLLGPPTLTAAAPVVVVGIGHWQSAERWSGDAAAAPGPDTAPTTGPGGGAGWSLVSCVVSPEFRFEHFELAPPCWEPGGDQV